MKFIFNKKKPEIRSNSSFELRKLDEKSIIGKINKIGSLNLFCLQHLPCCLSSSTIRLKSDLMKRCIEIINQYAQIESIIKCQIEVNLLKQMLLTKNQRIYLNQKFIGLPLDDLNYSNKLLNEFDLFRINESLQTK